MSLFDALQQDLESYLTKAEIAEVHEAFLLGEEAHSGQKRISGEDYITHPIAVARILAGLHLDTESIISAILHDVIEDTPLSKKAIADKFGDQVALLVDGVSKLTQIKFDSRAEAQAENFRKMVLAMVKDIRVILIKLADRLHNMRTISVLRPEKRRRIARETLEIYAPLAQRLGIHKFNVELEDLGFAARYPLRARILRKAVQKARGNRKQMMQEIEQALRQQLIDSGLKFISISGREKHLYSIYKKMLNKKMLFSEIMDVYAFRIIVPNIDSCYRVLGAIHQLYKPVPERFKDYIAIPKQNSYQSLHTTLFGPYGVPIEIQIRTEEMDYTAENGIAAHWLYKSPSSEENEAQMKARNWLKGLLEIQASSKNPLEFIENVKIDLFPDEVYLFTPHGDIMELPGGATAIDFAYAVHTDIGNSCIAAKINRRLAPLSTVLTNGQTIEIITAPGARPNPAWLNFVVTGKARSNIRNSIKEQKRSESVKLGEKLLEKSLQFLNMDIQKLNDAKWQQILQEYHYKTQDDLYEAIGLGNQLPIIIARYIYGLVEKSQQIKEVTSEDTVLSIKGTKGMLVTFADCCRPIPGDAIVGVFSKGKGLMIHTDQCKHIATLCENPENCIPVRWEEQVTGEYAVDLKVEVANQRGVLAQIANSIASTNADIEDIYIDAHDGRFNFIHLTILVKDRQHLARIMRRIRNIKSVARIYRAKTK